MADMWIAGAPAAGTGGRIAVADPATGQTVDEVPAATAEEVDAAVAAAASAFAAWRRTDTAERAAHLSRLADAAEAHAGALVALLTREQGKPTLEAQGELRHFLGGLRYYAEAATKLRGSYQELPSQFGPAYGLVTRRPMGVVGAITPWNFPLTLLANKVGPALAAGSWSWPGRRSSTSAWSWAAPTRRSCCPTPTWTPPSRTSRSAATGTAARRAWRPSARSSTPRSTRHSWTGWWSASGATSPGPATPAPTSPSCASGRCTPPPSATWSPRSSGTPSTAARRAWSAARRWTDQGTSSSRRWWWTHPRTRAWPPRRSSARSCRCGASVGSTRPSSGPTPPATGWGRRSGPAPRWRSTAPPASWRRG